MTLAVQEVVNPFAFKDGTIPKLKTSESISLVKTKFTFISVSKWVSCNALAVLDYLTKIYIAVLIDNFLHSLQVLYEGLRCF